MKHKKVFCLSLAAVMAFSVAMLAACGEKEAPKGPETIGALVPTEAYTLPTSADAEYFKEDVRVHDPSVFYDEKSKTYFAFGTHYAVASSPDLIEWTREVTDEQWHAAALKNKFNFKLYDEANPVTYGGKQWPAALDETLKIVNPTANGNDTIGTTWAPDVNYYNGKYYMYYSITKAFGSDKSAIGRVESNSVTGPYSNNTIIIESVTSTESDHPNCIDPELFTDKDGGLWMVYGSFFGGIYVKELYNSGDNWGLPKEEGWGKLVWKNGYEAGVEGPFIFYNPLTEYYYLMVSEGDLNSVYNMRIARSEKPDGPYVDVTGKDVATAEGKGNKVAGNFKFARQSGSNGYAAMGHNSVVQDPKTGEWFVVYHARRYTKSNHNLMVSQLYFNEDKWPVMAPSAYVGESFGKVTQEQAAGTYELILHSVNNAETQVPSVDYTLGADGTVKKGTESAGSWTVKQDFYVEITLGEEVYKGVIVPVWDIYSAKANRKGVLGITAINASGNSLWALGK